MPKSFEQLKALVGEWEGTSTMEGKTQKAKASYELTSGGTAIIEKLFVGTPNEMTSVYHADGNKLAMTHYCSLGNQPKLKLKKSSKNKMRFEMKGKEGIQSKNEMHIHGLTIAWKDKNNIQHTWYSKNKGKDMDNTVVVLTRK